MISIVVPTYNRFIQTTDAVIQVLNDQRVSEIVIVDDASTDDSFDRLVTFFKHNRKVKIFRNEKNLDCYFNKHQTMEKATGEWCVLFDSDNTLTEDYIDALFFKKPWDSKTAYHPQFAFPHFDFRRWAGLTITKENVAQYADTNLMTSFNAMNFFINREEYLKVWDGSVDPITSDSIYFSLCWLEAGNKIYITPNLEYEHFIDPTGHGHYQQNQHKTVEFHKMVMDRIKKLS